MKVYICRLNLKTLVTLGIRNFFFYILFIYSMRFISVGTVAFSHQFFYRFHFQWRNWIHLKMWQKGKYVIEIEFAICVRKCYLQYYYSFSTLLTFASFQAFPSVVQEIQFHHLLNFIYTMPCRSVKHKTIKHMNMHWILLLYDKSIHNIKIWLCKNVEKLFKL